MAKLVFDTGSSTTWVQSAHCKTCFPVAVPTFDPTRSATYQRMRADHPLCATPSPPRGNSSDQFCSFSYEYYDGQRIKGDMSLETFTFGDDDSDLKIVPDVTFGCAIYNMNVKDFVNDTSNPISGVFGIGLDPTSLLFQLQNLTLLKFSYCLPLYIFHDHHHLHTLLRFGNDIQKIGGGAAGVVVQTTPLILDDIYGYALNLTNISFNGIGLLPIRRVLFVDSGTPYTSLAKELYSHLREAVVKFLQDKYGWRALRKTRSGMDLCYTRLDDHQGIGGFAFPQLEFNFQGGAVLQLNKDTTFQLFKQVDELCLMILPSRDDTILLGAFQHVNQRLFFDVGASKLSFAAEKC